MCTACANAFAHGSNEVANAVGPLAAIYQVWQTGQITSKAPIPTWLLAIGGLGICAGLATCECLVSGCQVDESQAHVHRCSLLRVSNDYS